MPATKIIVKNNGSIRVEGDFEIVDETGKAFDLAGRDAIGLCRCGQSANKPYCDGTHAAIKWRDNLEGEPVGETLPEEVY